jgi:hypothetical protein
VEKISLIDKLPSEQEFTNEINRGIGDIEKVISKYDPLQIIAFYAQGAMLKTPKSEILRPLVEYLINLTLLGGTGSDTPTQDVIEKLQKTWEMLFSSLTFHNIISANKKTLTKAEADVRFQLMTSNIGRRGNAYQCHIDQTCAGLFAVHDNVLQSNAGFTHKQFQEFINTVARDILGRVQKSIEAYVEKKDIGKLLKCSHLFEVKPSNKLETRILEQLSCQVGDNYSFLEPKKTAKWPMNDSIYERRPFLKFNGSYYLFVPSMPIWNQRFILESILKENDLDYYNDKFYKKRDAYVEEESVSILERMLQGSKSYPKLYYKHAENGTERFEIDGLTLLDDCILVVEAKAGALPPSAKRGSVLSFRGKMKEVLKKAHKQTLQTIKYIQSSQQAEFENERGDAVLTIKGSEYNHVIPVIVSLDALYWVGCNLPLAYDLGLLVSKEWPWVVALDDLRVFSEIMDNSSMFIQYLKRRIAINDQPIWASDELDIMMHYLKMGLFFPDEQLKNGDILILPPLTDELDAYYLTKSDEIHRAPKPEMALHPGIEKLLQLLERERPPNFITACLVLMEGDEFTRTAIGEFIVSEQPIPSYWRIDGQGLALFCLDHIDGKLLEKISERALAMLSVRNLIVIYWTIHDEVTVSRTLK